MYERVCKKRRRCAPPFFRYSRKTSLRGQNDPPPGRRLNTQYLLHGVQKRDTHHFGSFLHSACAIFSKLVIFINLKHGKKDECKGKAFKMLSDVEKAFCVETYIHFQEIVRSDPPTACQKTQLETQKLGGHVNSRFIGAPTCLTRC